MSINTEVNVETKQLNKAGNINNPSLKPSPFANDSFLRLDFLNPLSTAQAGVYERTIKLPRPIRPWHPASKGTTDKFEGCLTEIFPELKSLSEKELKEAQKLRGKT